MKINKIMRESTTAKYKKFGYGFYDYKLKKNYKGRRIKYFSKSARSQRKIETDKILNQELK